MKTLVNKNNPAISWIEKQKEQKPIFEVFGFKVGDAVRLKDGDGRKHIIKFFEEVEGIHGPNFYRVEFEDNSARDGIYPGEEYPNGYYTQMEKFEEEPKRKQSPALKKIADNLTEEKLAKTRAEMKIAEEEPEKVNCPFDKGDCRYCTVQFCGAREENHIETHSTAEPVDIEKIL